MQNLQRHVVQAFQDFNATAVVERMHERRGEHLKTTGRVWEVWSVDLLCCVGLEKIFGQKTYGFASARANVVELAAWVLQHALLSAVELARPAVVLGDALHDQREGREADLAVRQSGAVLMRLVSAHHQQDMSGCQ